jgi:hypothetical protein
MNFVPMMPTRSSPVFAAERFAAALDLDDLLDADLPMGVIS